MSRFAGLSAWLDWMESLHGQEIDLGLERVYRVALTLGLIEKRTESQEFSGRLSLAGARVITVAGTNGKGSCCATITAGLLATGQSVGTFTSPHFEHYCERICVDGQPVEEALVCQAFAAIDQARGDITLTYFEFGTLAALWIFSELQLSRVVLEVGLGGRLDAVNIVDADIAVLTSVDLDHQDWLGDDRNIISREKLGIARPGKPLIIAEQKLTPCLQEAAAKPGTLLINRDFYLWQQATGWQFRSAHRQYTFPGISLHPDSMGAALVALEQLGDLPDEKTLLNIMANVALTGRFQRRSIEGEQGRHLDLILDVAHNPAAARSLAQRLQQSANESVSAGKTLAVFALMADKDLAGIVDALAMDIDQWYPADLPGVPRALDGESLEIALSTHGLRVNSAVDIATALKNALKDANEHDRIVVFGSFFTVAAANRWLSEHHPD